MLAVPVVIEPAFALNRPSTLAIPLDLNVAELASPVMSTSDPAVTTPSNCEVVDTFINPVTVVLPDANVLLNVELSATVIESWKLTLPAKSPVLLKSTAPLA